MSDIFNMAGSVNANIVKAVIFQTVWYDNVSIFEFNGKFYLYFPYKYICLAQIKGPNL